jgi:hypothetical protein
MPFWLTAGGRPEPPAPTPSPGLSPANWADRPPNAEDVAVARPFQPGHVSTDPAPESVRTTIDTVTIDVCGWGRVTLPPDDPDPMQQLPGAVRAQALDEARAAMTGSGDPQARAAALLIGLRAGGGRARELADALARQANGSQDPAVYAMALEGCRGLATEDGGACGLLNRAQWARLDADNLLPWLELGAEAHARGDPGAEADAMSRAALARRSDGYEGLVPELVDRSLGRGAPSLRDALALAASRSVQTTWSASRSHHAYEYCVSGAGADVDRMTCDAIAATLARRSLNASDRRAGLAMGRQLGWPEERLQALQRADADAMAELPPVDLDLSCDGVSRVERRLRQLASRGDMASGDVPEHLVPR